VHVPILSLAVSYGVTYAVSDVHDTSLLLSLCQCRATHVQPTLPPSLPYTSFSIPFQC
jgi:hypothetical protein